MERESFLRMSNMNPSMQQEISSKTGRRSTDKMARTGKQEGKPAEALRESLRCLWNPRLS